jgi:thiamine-monophosphate kinase
VNLSDLAAKGAAPFAYVMALALPGDWTEAWLRDFAAGLAVDDKRYGVSLIGGDTILAAGGVTVSITALGSVPTGGMVRRLGARPGDLIMVTGTIGDAALALGIRRGALPDDVGRYALLERYLWPEPRVALVEALRRYATSAIDVSDGLVGDLAHICDVSGVGAEVIADAVPLSEPARRLLAGHPPLRMLVLNGGDDYEILATVAPENAERFQEAAAAAGVTVSRIGTILAGKGPPVVKDAEGRAITLIGHSHEHF